MHSEVLRYPEAEAFHLDLFEQISSFWSKEIIKKKSNNLKFAVVVYANTWALFIGRYVFKNI